MKSLLAGLVLAYTIISAPALAASPKEAALARAFPAAERIETRTLFLDAEQRAQAEQQSGTRIDSGLYSYYVGFHGDQVTGYAAIEAAVIRTQPATIMVVLNPDHSVRFVEILAFFEPPEYRPPQRWLAQFDRQHLNPQLRVGGDIQGITGATLSAHALTRQVRKVTALASYLDPKR